jgi:hypothetical protein
MPSKAKVALDENLGDVERLLELHQEKGGGARGRRYGLEVLNKAAIVLITSYGSPIAKTLPRKHLSTSSLIRPTRKTSRWK